MGSAQPSGVIVHLSYAGIAASPALVASSMSKVTKIYVGPGESESGDQAILDQYLEDTDWAEYSAKLDTWWNYCHSEDANPEYVNSPFDE